MAVSALYPAATQNRCFSPRMRIRLDAGTGEPITGSSMLFSERSSNLSLATLATKTTPSSRGANSLSPATRGEA